ncbi:RtcB family protein [Massilia antarctica]|uniref:tRNA-splicing ligase RtcB n=1 Tax=Massilia antarctica TaxID=2765360 RepID=A0AA49A6P7_9BURK|nr:RtcB family protein [Massilia antarctica]QPI47765.1 RtcB family protein [Massilia antarctica]
MSTTVSAKRLAKALASHNIFAEREGNILRVQSTLRSDVRAEILLPDSLPLEAKAVSQLLAFAGMRHPHGGHVCRACATPDFHPGAPVPVGSILVTNHDFVVPESIGRDINCGMRLHVLDVPLERFLAHKERLVALLKGDLLEAARNVPTTPAAMTALFSDGLGAFWRTMRNTREGLFAHIDFAQVEAETARLFAASHIAGNAHYAPEALQDTRRGLLRDPGLATLGAGNHFCEFQTVSQVLDRHRAFELGVRPGQLALMVHSGSRDVGSYIGTRWMDRAKAEWPSGVKHPESGLYGLCGPLAAEYLTAMHAAAHYADANRALIVELVRQRIRQVFGDQSMPLVCDVPHNIVLSEADGNVHRKGATPAHAGQPLLIPGSMGDDSYLLDGLGHERWASSASHGAGRAVSRMEMAWKSKHDAGAGTQRQFECITLREERRIEEAPGAYKPIGPVIESQVEEGLVRPIAKLAPLLTFKA